MAPTTWHRRLDLVYLVFFIIHIPVMFAVDLYPLYPSSLRPASLTSLRAWYVSTYKDRFFIEGRQPAWFWMFTVLEAVVHVPVAFGSIGPLWRGRGDDESPIFHLHLLLFAFETVLTTAVCIAEYSSWPELSAAEKSKLGGLYIPYFVFAAAMSVDMYGRVKARLTEARGSPQRAKVS